MISFGSGRNLAKQPLALNTARPKADLQPLMSENTLIRQLKPSQVKSKIRQVFDNFIRWIIQFFTVSRPNVIREKLVWMIRNQAGSGLGNSIPLSFHELWNHYSRFLQNESTLSPYLKTCIQNLQKDEDSIQQLINRKDVNDKNKNEVENNKFVQTHVNHILQMKEGESRLLRLARHPAPDGTSDGNLFCLINKREDHYSLRLMAHGAPMPDQLFEKIPATALNQHDVLKKILEAWVTNEVDVQEFNKTIAHLDPYKIDVKKANVASQAKRVDQLFWNVIGSFITPEKAGETCASQLQVKRLKLRSNILTLFDLFQTMRYDLKPHTTDYHLLTQLFEEMSAKTLEAHQRGYLSQEDLQYINQDLAIIDRALQDAKKVPVSLPLKYSFQDPTLDKVFLKDFPVCAKQNVAEPSLIEPRELTKTSIKTLKNPIETSGLRPVPSTVYGEIDSKEAFLVTFRDLFEKLQTAVNEKRPEKDVWKKQFMRLFDEIPYKLFHPSIRNEQNQCYSAEKNEQSFWWNLSKVEGQEIIEKISQVTQIIADDESIISQYAYFSLVRMTEILFFLNAVSTGYCIDKYCDFIQYSKRENSYHSRLYTQHTHWKISNLIEHSDIWEQHFKLLTQERPYTVIINGQREIDDGFTRYKFLTKADKKEVTLAKEDVTFIHKQKTLIETILTRMPVDFNNRLDKAERSKLEASGDFSRSYRNFDNEGSYNLCFSSQWVRPIKDPYLQALYRFFVTDSTSSDHSSKKALKERENIESDIANPEAFHTDPDGIIDYTFETAYTRMQKNLQTHTDNSNNAGPDDAVTLPTQIFTTDEIKRLMRLLQKGASIGEFTAFMHESPHLMRNSDVRNFFNALMFHGFYHEYSLFSHKQDSQYWINQIEVEIQRLETAVEETLRVGKIADLQLLQARVDTLLYYYETKENLYQLIKTKDKEKNVKITSSLSNLEKLRNICLERTELKGCLGYATRVHLQVLLQQHTAADMPEILKDYAFIFGVTTDPANLDPVFDETLRLHWHEIAKDLEATRPNLQPFFDRICYEKGLPIDGSEWKRVDDFIYQNSTYTFNTQTISLSKIGETAKFERVPASIIEEFTDILGKEAILASVSEEGGKQIYSFKEASGCSVQLEKDQNMVRVYKKFPDGKWLQYIPQKYLIASDKMSQIKQLLDSKKSGIKEYFQAFRKILSLMTEANTAFPFLYETVFVDSKDPSILYSVNKEGQLAFKLNCKQTENGLTIEKITDLRSADAVDYQIGAPNQESSEALDVLSQFESKENMIFWHQKGYLKKIELPRYGLSFQLQGERFVCLNPGYSGYFIDFSSSLQEKQGLPHALVLKHSDCSKPSKLLVPKAEFIQAEITQELATARGFGKIGLWIDQLKNLLRMIRRLYPISDVRFKYAIKSKRQHLSFVSFDIRPNTGEIVGKNQIIDRLELIKQALKVDQPALAEKLMRTLHISSETLNQKVLNALFAFVQTPISVHSAEDAIKIKLCIALKKILKKQNKLRSDLKDTINRGLVQLSQRFFMHKANVRSVRGLTIPEFLHVAKLMKKIDLAYYKAHIEPLVSRTVSQTVTKDPLQTSIDAWKKERSPIKLLDRINLLEKDIQPHVRLRDSQLTSPIPKAEKTSLFAFSSVEEDQLFKKETPTLPTIDLMSFKAKTSCEQEALKQYQADIDQFRKEEQGRLRYHIKVSKTELRAFADKKLAAQRRSFEEKAASIKHSIESFVRQTSSETEQLAIFAGKKQMASLDELRQALVQGHLEQLKETGRLPASLDIKKLQELLISYFDALSRKNATQAAITMIDDIIHRGQEQNKEEWQSMSTALYRLLSIQRSYDINKEPRLLVFEAQQFLNIRKLEGGLDQLDLLNALISDPYAIIQAPTGSGKTAVLSVMRSLLTSTGKNLNVQQVLPALYQQTHDQLKEVLGDLFGTLIYSLRFNLKMPLVKKEAVKVQNEKGKWEEKEQEYSVFKSIYCDMLENIKEKGCFLTDYKTIALLEEMWFKNAQMMLQNKLQGIPINPLLAEHHHYLQKILILTSNKSGANGDEFDQPLKPNQKIQIDLGIGSQPIPPFMIEHSLEVFELLEKDPQLKLVKNLQEDVSAEMRKDAIARVAMTMANRCAKEAGNEALEAEILEYITGKNENVLAKLEGKNPALKDKITFLKDQIFINLPLTLRFKEGSRYARSVDGSKTLVCSNGERREAKFGTIIEQINYTIADYLQKGVTLYDLKPWIADCKQKFDDARDEQEKRRVVERFNHIFPALSILEVTEMVNSKDKGEKLVAIVNHDVSKIKEFLKIRLTQLRTSGAVISMDPQNMVDMHRSVSGVSATMGAAESLHRQFHLDRHLNGQIQASMVCRLLKRAEKQAVVLYDPENPGSMITDSIHAIIDGSGAFKDAKQAAALLKAKNPSLEGVGYHTQEAEIEWMGRKESDLKKKGFAFGQAQTRGTDITLLPDAKAILTLNAKDGIREFFQKEGRLRQERQRYVLAMPKDQGITTVTQEIAHAICQDALADAQDIFRNCKQELMGIMRFERRKRLLQTTSVEQFLTLFEKDFSHFITPTEPHFAEAGSYFAARCHIQKEDQTPGDVLNALKADLITQAKAEGLEGAVERLNQIVYSTEALRKMPEKVAGLHAAQGDLGLDLEVEQETEQDTENDLELTTQTEMVKHEKKAIASYPVRLSEASKLHHSVKEKIHSAYDERLHVMDAFLPFSRVGTASLHQRRPFDESMYRIGMIGITMKKTASDDYSSYLSYPWKKRYVRAELPQVENVIIEDPLDTYYQGYEFRYDIRTDQILCHAPSLIGGASYFTENGEKSLTDDINLLKRIPSVASVIAQVKFLDGRLSGYSEQEMNQLSLWLITNDPQQMEHHLLNDILRFRYKDKQEFVGSQLHRLFTELKDLVARPVV